MNRTPFPSSLSAAAIVCVLVAGTAACGGKPAATAGQDAGAAGTPQGAGAQKEGWGDAARPAGAAGQGPGAIGGEANPGAVASISGQPIPYKSFERYLNDNSVEAGEQGDEADAIKSRLLDQFIDEQLLMREAGHFSIVVSDAEVDAYIKELGLSEGDLDVNAPDGKDAFREKIKTGLVVQKVKETAVLKTIHVAPAEVEDELKKRPEAARGRSQVVLRQIMLEDKGSAEEVRRSVTADPGRFEEVARKKSAAPDHGAPRAFSEEDLPAELRPAVASLQPGQVSPVLGYAGAFLVIQLVRKEEAKPADLASVKQKIEAELFRQKADQVMERYLADLKEKTEIHVNRAILPFQYQGENRN